jgi:hypothetical protein
MWFIGPKLGYMAIYITDQLSHSNPPPPPTPPSQTTTTTPASHPLPPTPPLILSSLLLGLIGYIIHVTNCLTHLYLICLQRCHSWMNCSSTRGPLQGRKLPDSDRVSLPVFYIYSYNLLPCREASYYSIPAQWPLQRGSNYQSFIHRDIPFCLVGRHRNCIQRPLHAFGYS